MNTEILVKRLKGFAWSLGMMTLAMSIDFGLENLSEFNLSPQLTIILGLVLAQVSKFLAVDLRSSTK